MADFITCVGDGPEDLKEGRDWIESHKIMRPVGREDKIVYTFSFYWCEEETRVDVAEHLHRCVEELKKNKTLFIQIDMLRSVHQSQSQTEKNFSNLMQQFHNIIENIIGDDFNMHNPTAESYISATWMSPLHVLTWLVIPAFLLKACISIETSAESSYVFEMFREVCGKVGQRILVTDQSAKKLPLTLEIYHGTVHMFIYEDADIHSAVNMIVEYLWNMTDQELCELTEVYVQESIHSKFTFLLTKKLSVKAANHKWIKNCNEDCQSYAKYSDYIQNAVSVATSKGMEVYKPWEHAETFVPTIIFGKVERKQADIPLPVMCVDSFRTIEEGILLSEKSQKIQFASIWTENGPTAQYIADQLKANFVWVNTYGLFNTKVPFHLTVCVKGNCIHCISGCCISGHNWFFPMCQSHQQAVPLEFWKSVRENSDIKSMYKSAEQSHMKWGRASNSTARCELLLRIVYDVLYNKEQYLEILENPDCLEECVQLLYSFAYKCKEDCISRNFENMLSITTSKSLGVVTIVCTPQSKIIDYLWIIIGAIAYGNSVVLIHATNDKLAECVKAFFQYIELPKGSVNFLNYDYLSNTRDFFVDKSYYWLHPCGSDVTDHSVIEAVFRIDITQYNTTRFRWFTESKSVFIPVK